MNSRTSGLDPTYLQFGGGLTAPTGWANFDNSPTLLFERLPIIGRLHTKNAARFPPNVRYGDIVKGLPIEPGSCAAVFCSHVLEHLAFEDVGIALRHTFEYLRRGGIFRLVVPDLECSARTYLSDRDPLAAHRFLDSTGLGRRRRARGLTERLAEAFGHSAHLWMWDEKALAYTLISTGFTEIRRARFGDAEDPRFGDVENRGRFEGHLAIQCVKP